MREIILKKNLRSRILAVLIGVFPRVILPYNVKSKVDTVTSAMNPVYLSKLMIYGMILCGICLLLTGLVLEKDETLEVEMGREGYAVLYFVLFLSYMFATKYVGFLIASVIFSTVSTWMMEDRDWRYYLFAKLPVIVTFIPFKYGLHVALPAMIL